mmetsp:Transcript_10058/g.30862  ORF Transcript_10058/g.30862 Transcript_10058/m.30862 type:complete len:131 (-) Transcript_10058:924-1316(-)
MPLSGVPTDAPRPIVEQLSGPDQSSLARTSRLMRELVVSSSRPFAVAPPVPWGQVGEYAAAHGDVRLLEWAVAHGARVDPVEATSAAARLDRRPVLEWLYEHHLLRWRRRQRRSPAARRGVGAARRHRRS